MKYLIGIDGGGTKSSCVVTDHEGNTLHKCNGGPTNFLVYGFEKVNENLLAILTECKHALNAEFNEFESIVLGTAGAGRSTDAENLQKSFIDYAASHDIILNHFLVESDARIALEGAFSGGPGSILISGTGSIMFGKDRREKIYRVGGFGRHIGDQGSGYMIGRKGLISVSKHFDGRGPETSLTELLKDNFNIDNPNKLIAEVYTNNFDIASAAPLVIKAAREGDTVCVNILLEEMDELILHLYSMYKKLKEPVLNVSLIGGILSSENYFSNLFREEVKKNLTNIIIKEPELPPEMGAILLAGSFH